MPQCKNKKGKTLCVFPFSAPKNTVKLNFTNAILCFKSRLIKYCDKTN